MSQSSNPGNVELFIHWTILTQTKMTQSKAIFRIKLIWNNSFFDIKVTGFSSNWRFSDLRDFNSFILWAYWVNLLHKNASYFKIWKRIYLWWARKSRTDSCRIRPRLKLIAPPQGKLITSLNFRQSNYNMLNFTQVYLINFFVDCKQKNFWNFSKIELSLKVSTVNQSHGYKFSD